MYLGDAHFNTPMLLIDLSFLNLLNMLPDIGLIYVFDAAWFTGLRDTVNVIFIFFDVSNFMLICFCLILHNNQPFNGEIVSFVPY